MRSPGVLKNNIDFNAVKGRTKIPEPEVERPARPFQPAGFVLVNDNFEFPDLLGAAYEYLIKFSRTAPGKKGGEFYTPGEVVRLLVQLTQRKLATPSTTLRSALAASLIQSHQ